MNHEKLCWQSFSQFCKMISESAHSFRNVKETTQISRLKNFLLGTAFFNLFLTASLGLLLRSVPLLNSFPLEYKNLLHGHSHFAFGGWAMPILIWLVMQYFPSVTSRISFVHWRNIIFTAILSAYGMLFSFPFEGYGVGSIIFSTLSVASGYYLAIVFLKASKDEKEKTSVRFLRAGLFYFMLSAIGPFATGPLVAMGKQGAPIYFDAIYFYLHFQYNGWFTFAVLAVLYSILEKKTNVNGKKAFSFLNISCFPAYFLSILWNHPNAIFYWISGVAAFLQLIAVYFLVKDLLHYKEENRFIKTIIRLVIAAFVLKNVLQFFSAFPKIADLAYDNRNFIIAYLHLVLLGFISLFAFAFVMKAKKELMHFSFIKAVQVFLFAFVVTEFLLVANAYGNVLGFIIPHFEVMLFAFTCLLPASVLILFVRMQLQFRSEKNSVHSAVAEQINEPAWSK